MFLIIHSLNLSGIYSELISAKYLFLTNSITSKMYIDKIQKNYPDFCKAYNYMLKLTSDNQYRVLFLNKFKNYAIIFNIHDLVFVPERMFFTEKQYIIHDAEHNCSLENEEQIITHEIPSFVKDILSTYKQKRKPQLLVNYLISQKLISEKNLMVGETQNFTNTLHLFDFIHLISIPNFQKNRYPKIDSNTRAFLREFHQFSTSYPRSIFPKHVLKIMS